jgi:two-component system response regulator PilR (NtrC family)
MTQHKVLVVDDEADIRELLEITLNRMGLDTRSAGDLTTARRLLGEQTFHLCLTDMRLPDGTGIDLVRTIQEQHPELPVAVVTAYGSQETAIDSLKAGAFDFVSKPVELEQLRSLVNSALKLDDAPQSFSYGDEPQLLGDTPAIQALRKQIAKLARSQAPVYISGESGTGKELVARLIHANGPRAAGPFVPVNCGAIPGELMESEFFGHKKGSFTGAIEDKPGLFQAAQGGTLFLDEVADLPLNMQVKLLRAIQEKAVRPIGGHEEISTDTRILSATHKNLACEVEAERFRGDLFYRINVIQLEVPSLRQRHEDIPLLTGFILENLAQDWEMPKPELDEAAIQKLSHYHFPGNVRELENILERSATLCEGNCIQAEDLQLQVDSSAAATVAEDRQLLTPIDTSQPVSSLETYLENIEKEVISKALERCRWNKTEAAKTLGISFRALRYRLKKLELE